MSPRLPRDLNGVQLAHALGALGYQIARQTGSHIRLTTRQKGEHHITIPAHTPLRVGTLAAILADVGEHFGIKRGELLDKLFS